MTVEDLEKYLSTIPNTQKEIKIDGKNISIENIQNTENNINIITNE